jgi:hypothetical protein
LGFPEGHLECLGSRWSQRYVSMLTGMWFILATVTPAVALDPQAYPLRPEGQLFVVVIMVCGVFFLAMPLSTIGENFSRVWDERMLIKVQNLMRQLLLENKMTPDDCRMAFKHVDKNKDGLISFGEFVSFLTDTLGLVVPKGDLRVLWRTFDEDNSGSIDFREFVTALFPSYQQDRTRYSEIQRRCSVDIQKMLLKDSPVTSTSLEAQGAPASSGGTPWGTPFGGACSGDPLANAQMAMDLEGKAGGRSSGQRLPITPAAGAPLWGPGAAAGAAHRHSMSGGSKFSRLEMQLSQLSATQDAMQGRLAALTGQLQTVVEMLEGQGTGGGGHAGASPGSLSARSSRRGIVDVDEYNA